MDDKAFGDLLAQWKLLAGLLTPTLQLVHALQREPEYPLLLQVDSGFAEGFLQIETPIQALLKNQEELYVSLQALVTSMELASRDVEIGNQMILDRINLLRTRRGAEPYKDLSGINN